MLKVIKIWWSNFNNRHGTLLTEEEQKTYDITIVDLYSRGIEGLKDAERSIQYRKSIGNPNWGGIQRAINEYSNYIKTLQ